MSDTMLNTWSHLTFTKTSWDLFSLTIPFKKKKSSLSDVHLDVPIHLKIYPEDVLAKNSF